MTLLPPEVVGPLSVCSTSAWIRGNISGATIHVVVAGHVMASHVTTGSDGVYSIGVTLQANQEVTVWQELTGSSPSVAGPVVTVQDVPATVNALTLPTPLHECGRAVFMTGGVPGAKVEGDVNNAFAGSGDVIAGHVGFTYEPVIGMNHAMALKQTTCNNLVSAQNSPIAVPQPSPLPVPFIEPLFACQNSITISGVLEGAYVEVFRNGATKPESAFTFSLSREWNWIKTLNNGDKIEVRQGFNCAKGGPVDAIWSAKAVAHVTDQTPAPEFLSSPCPGMQFVTLGNLIPGTRVVLLNNDRELGETDAPDSIYTFKNIPPIREGAISAYMMLCRKKGPQATIKVRPGAKAPDKVNVSDLYACAASVYVQMEMNSPGLFSPQFLVYITTGKTNQISAYEYVEYYKLIGVSPSLIENEQIYVHALGCSGAWNAYGPFTVKSGAPLPLPKVVPSPLLTHTQKLDIEGTYAGALVTGYVNNKYQGFTISEGNLSNNTFAEIYLQKEVLTGDIVSVTQTMCGIPSKPSKVTVKKLPPLAPKLLTPSNGSTDVALQPLFEWSDPGASQENHAESYELVIARPDGHPVSGTTGLVFPQWPLTDTLKNGTTYKWYVISTNSTGSQSASPAGLFSFRTKDGPKPPDPKPIITVTYHGPASSASFNIKGSGFLPNHAVHIRVVNTTTVVTVFVQAGSDGAGGLDYEFNVPNLPPGTTLAFSANDARPDPNDATGTLWSNIVVITAT